jgi:hypothetical protein
MGAQLVLDARQGCLYCPWHGLALDLQTRTTNHPRYKTLKEFPAEVVGDELIIRLRGED